MIVVVDTNVWISAAINQNGAPAKLARAWQSGSFQCVVSEYMLSELSEVLSRRRIARAHGWTQEQQERFVNSLASNASVVEPTGELRLCRDPNDDMILETAILGSADYLVTRDDDIKDDRELIARLSERNVNVVTVRQFQELLD